MKKFLGILTTSEIAVFLGTLLIIVVLTLINFSASARRERNENRSSNLDMIVEAMKKFHKTYGFYPLSSSDHKIVACVGEKTIIRRGTRNFINPVPCEWETDSFSEDPTDPGLAPLLTIIPTDPDSANGVRYHYRSDGKNFQIYAAYEGRPHLEYKSSVEKLGLPCGNKICNSGKANSDDVALDVPLEFVNNEIEDEQN